MFDYDYNKTIFIIDSMTSAFMIAIMTNDRPVKVIFEYKSTIMNEVAFENLKQFSFKCINIISFQEYSVPHPFFFYVDGFVNEMRNLKRFSIDMKGTGFEEYDDMVYVGATVSSIISSLNCKNNHIVYLYHGVGDYLREVPICSFFQKSKLLIKRILYKNVISKYTDVNNWPWGLGLKMNNVYSMCNNEKCNLINWVDCSKFKSLQIKKVLDGLVRHDDNNQRILFLPYIEVIKQNGINKDTTKYDDINIRIVTKHFLPSTTIYVKFHPSLYRIKMGKDIRVGLIGKLNERGYNVIDIAELIPDEIGGAMIPAEVLLKYLKFDCIITYDSSTMWHLQGYEDLKKIIDIQELPSHAYNRLKKINDSMRTLYRNDITFCE